MFEDSVNEIPPVSDASTPAPPTSDVSALTTLQPKCAVDLSPVEVINTDLPADWMYTT